MTAAEGTGRGAERVRQAWGAWKAEVAARQPEGLAVLRGPASDEDLHALRQALDGRWSAHLEALYRENDGEDQSMVEDQLAFLFIPEDPGMCYFLMPLSGGDGVIAELDLVNDVIGRQREHGEDVADLGPDALLVPFGKDFSGNSICVVLPPPGGTEEGPVFQANHGDGVYGVVARDLAQYFAILPTIRMDSTADGY